MVVKDIASLHREEYGCLPAVVARAPGVVPIMGEHTEHTGGFVLPFAINRSVSCAVSLRKDSSFRFFAADYSERKRTSLSNMKFRREDRWANYLKGVIGSFLEAGHEIRGLDMTVTGDIPPGIGLGSSAALTVAAACGVKNVLGLTASGKVLAEYAHRAEAKFMEASCGVIGTFTSSLARSRQAILLDTLHLEHRYVPLGLKGVKLLITDSQVPRLVGDGDLALHGNDYALSMEVLSRRRPRARTRVGAEAGAGTNLRDYSPKDIRESIGLLPETVRRKCLHIVEENARVLEAEELLRSRGNLAALGKLLTRSHESLRDLLEVSCPEIDWLVKRSSETEGVLGSRLTGTGFGRCTITLIREGAIAEYEKRLEEYERIFGFKAKAFVCEASQGVKLL
ncbi:MAG: galactokinase [Spirochaetales bacterium]|jgi:galactokinase|nr:galactokinase [Spirochaetales bacterium]